MIIERLRLENFKRFQEFEIEFDERLNTLIGDNEAGKSSILLALDLLLGASRSRVQAIGLENLFNKDVITSFLKSDMKFEKLPKLVIEIYLKDSNNHLLNGRNNSRQIICDGLTLTCEPSDSMSAEIAELLSDKVQHFPFEYYDIKFQTFAAQSYFSHNRYVNHLLIDSTSINGEYASKEYVKTLYQSNIESSEKERHQHEYRKTRREFGQNSLTKINERTKTYTFELRSGGNFHIENDLTISEDGIPIENKGKGKQCFIKTDFALARKTKDGKRQLHTILLEEPENHLSHGTMKRLIERIVTAGEKQLFITTHNSLIASRLDLKKAIMLNSGNTRALKLNSLDGATADYFMKAPDHNLLEFVLSKKVILVEGDAEYLLVNCFYESVVGESPERNEVHILSVGGTSFKRYLALTKILNIRTAVIRDNDRDFQKNCIDNYLDFAVPNIQIFFDKNDDNHTFEVCIYKQNQTVCDAAFLSSRKTLSVQEYMKSNKTEAAFALLQNSSSLVAPDYIREACLWISE